MLLLLIPAMGLYPIPTPDLSPHTAEPPLAEPLPGLFPSPWTAIPLVMTDLLALLSLLLT